jgi:hypothetical protein
MSDTIWLVVVLVSGSLAAIGWVKRELWIQRRRRQRRQGERALLPRPGTGDEPISPTRSETQEEPK